MRPLHTVTVIFTVKVIGDKRFSSNPSQGEDSVELTVTEDVLDGIDLEPIVIELLKSARSKCLTG